MTQQPAPPAPQPGYNKVTAGGLSGAISTVIIWGLDTYVLPTPLPDLVVGAVTTIIIGLFVMFVPEKFRNA